MQTCTEYNNMSVSHTGLLRVPPNSVIAWHSSPSTSFFFRWASSKFYDSFTKQQHSMPSSAPAHCFFKVSWATWNQSLKNYGLSCNAIFFALCICTKDLATKRNHGKENGKDVCAKFFLTTVRRLTRFHTDPSPLWVICNKIWEKG